MAESYINAPQSDVLKNLSSSLREGFNTWFNTRSTKRKKKTASKPTRIIDANIARRMGK